MGKQWKNPPVYYVVAQVRFNPILSLAAYIANIQEDFRKASFPDFKRGVNVVFNANLLQGFKAGEDLPVQQTDRFLFSNIEGTDVFILEQNALSFRTTAYKTFSVLQEMFLSRFEYLKENLSLSFSDRIGLRYLDAVIPTEKTTLKDLLIPEAFGIQSKVNGDLNHSFTETFFEMDGAKVVSRVTIQNGPLGVPPDLHSTGGKLDQRFASYIGEHAIIDNDSFFDGRSEIGRASIEKKFQELHEHVDTAFYATITKRAVTMWS